LLRPQVPCRQVPGLRRGGATAIPHQVGHSHRRCRISSVSHIRFQVFYLDVVYVAIAIYTYCKRMLQMFQMFLDVCCNVSSECFKCRSCVAHVAMAIHARFRCFIYFRCMLQMFHK
jgi:hypothetical protein